MCALCRVELPVLFAASALVFDESGNVLLIRENYDRRRYGLPGGALESGETPVEAAVRETREETGVDVAAGPLVGVYTLRSPEHTLVGFVFHSTVDRGEAAVPDTGEIAEVGWFDPRALPEPRTNMLAPALEDALAGRLGAAREIPKLN